MTTTFLLSEAKFREYSDVVNNLDTSLIKNAIREAQDIELQRIIGTLLYQKLLSDVDSSSLTGAYKTLVDNYIQDFLIYATYFYALESIYLRSRNNGLIQLNGGDTADSANQQLFNLKRQSQKNKMEYYAERLKDYIIEEEASFPELTQSNKLYEQNPDYSEQYGSPFVFRKDGFAQAAADRGIPLYSKRYKQYPPN